MPFAVRRITYQDESLVPSPCDDCDAVGPVVLDDAPVEEDAEAQLVLHHSNPLLEVHGGVQVARDVPAAGVRHQCLKLGQVLPLLQCFSRGYQTFVAGFDTDFVV